MNYQELLKNINKIHTTKMGFERIKKNLPFQDTDIIEWCKKEVLNKENLIKREGKNWYIYTKNSIITVNASSYTIITAHKRKQAKHD